MIVIILPDGTERRPRPDHRHYYPYYPTRHDTVPENRPRPRPTIVFSGGRFEKVMPEQIRRLVNRDEVIC